MNNQNLTKEEVLVIDKIMHEAKITDYFKLRFTKTGRQYFWNSEDSERLNIRDGLQYICNTTLYGFDFAFEFGLTQQEIGTWNAMIDRFGLSDEFKAENFKEREILHKESYGLDDIFEPEFDIGDRVWFHDDEGESNWFIVTNIYDDDRYDLESEDGEVVVQDVDGSKLSSSPVDGEMFHETTRKQTMKKLNITKDKFTESKYFQTKYGKLKYVSESGKIYKTSKGHLLKFINESQNDVTIDDFRRMYGKNAAEALIKYCDVKNKDAESVINGSDSDMARFENWAKKVLHVDIYDKFSGYDYDSDLDDSRSEVDESSNDIEIELENLLDIVHNNGMTYDEMESSLKKLGFEMNEYGGERNAYAIFKHPCGIDVTVEYEFEKVVGSKDSWKAGMVTDISW